MEGREWLGWEEVGEKVGIEDIVVEEDDCCFMDFGIFGLLFWVGDNLRRFMEERG